ncbi:MAG: epsF 3 [Verrucomicrobiales bacterium]|nr:epsF 3 [Verrucomicrobiales bacterium]
MIFSNKAETRSQFFHELARLTGAGISISRASSVLNQNWRDPSVKAALHSLEKGLKEGETISGALAPALTGMESGIVDAAERGGKLVHGFKYLEDYYHLLGQTFTRMRAAAVYPLVMLHAAVLLPAMVAGVLAGWEVPVIGLSLALRLLVLWSVLALAGIAWRFLLKKGAHSLPVDRFLRRLPMAGRAREALGLARWSAVVYFHVISGQRISDGLRRAGQASDSAGLVLASRRAADDIEAGGEMGPALAAQPAFPHELSGALAAAEFTGTLDTETLQQSRYWISEAGLRLENTSRWLSGAFYGLVMLFTVIQIFRLATGYVQMVDGFMKDIGI